MAGLSTSAIIVVVSVPQVVVPVLITVSTAVMGIPSVFVPQHAVITQEITHAVDIRLTRTIPMNTGLHGMLPKSWVTIHWKFRL